MITSRASDPKDDTDRFYMSRKEGGRGLISIEDCVDATIQEIEEYTKKSKARLNTAGRDNLKTNSKAKNLENKNRKKNNCMYNSKNKLWKLH